MNEATKQRGYTTDRTRCNESVGDGHFNPILGPGDHRDVFVSWGFCAAGIVISEMFFQKIPTPKKPIFWQGFFESPENVTYIFEPPPPEKG